MYRYQLSAELLARKQMIIFDDLSDIDAIYTAIFKTLNKAAKNRIWARGRIKLVNLSTGELIKEMEPK